MAKRRAKTREGTVITTIALARDLHRRLVIAALEENAAAAELIREAVRQFLAEREVRRKGEQP